MRENVLGDKIVGLVYQIFDRVELSCLFCICLQQVAFLRLNGQEGNVYAFEVVFDSDNLHVGLVGVKNCFVMCLIFLIWNFCVHFLLKNDDAFVLLFENFQDHLLLLCHGVLQIKES